MSTEEKKHKNEQETVPQAVTIPMKHWKYDYRDLQSTYQM